MASAHLRGPESSHRRISDCLPMLREHGIEGFEVPMFDPADVPAFEVRRACEESGIECTVCAILPARINPIAQDAAVRSNALAHLTRCIETSAAMGVHLVCGPVYAPIGELPGRRRTQQEWDWAVECFQRLGVVLDTHQVTLSIEPINRSETFFLNTCADAKALCEDYQSSPHRRKHRYISRQYRGEKHRGRSPISGKNSETRSRKRERSRPARLRSCGLRRHRRGVAAA